MPSRVKRRAKALSGVLGNPPCRGSALCLSAACTRELFRAYRELVFGTLLQKRGARFGAEECFGIRDAKGHSLVRSEGLAQSRRWECIGSGQGNRCGIVGLASLLLFRREPSLFSAEHLKRALEPAFLGLWGKRRERIYVVQAMELSVKLRKC